jgi:hypothetical protein
MNLQIYKPNSKNTGCAISFQISHYKKEQEPQFFINCIRQHSWDDRKKTGSFAGNRKDNAKFIALKFNEFELGEIIHTFRSYDPYYSFHSSSETKTQIRLTSYPKKRGKGEFSAEIKAFGLTIIRNGSDTFKIPLDPGECYRIISLIERYFRVLDDYREAKAKKNFSENYSNTKFVKDKHKEPKPDENQAEENETQEYEF